MSKPWLPEQDLRSRLAALRGVTSRSIPPCVTEWQGTTYRFASRDFADRDRFTSGEGARRHGGRFTPIGAHRTLYLSTDRATATAELDSWYAYYQVPDTAFRPHILAAISVSAGLVLDVTAPETLAALELGETELLAEWRPDSDTGRVAPVQVFGRLVFETGYEGLLFASARRPQARNLALFPDNFRDSSHAVVMNWS